MLTEQISAALAARECPYSHPIGTRCPNCSDWPFKKGGAAAYTASLILTSPKEPNMQDDTSALAAELAALFERANEPKPLPIPEQDTRVGEAMAGSADDRNRAEWTERVDRATAGILKLVPAILAALNTRPAPSGEEVERATALSPRIKPMLDEQMKAAGWIEHDGGPCPVDPDDTVSLLLGSGSAQTGWAASKVVWPHNAFIYELGEVIPPDARVIAFRPEGQTDA